MTTYWSRFGLAFLALAAAAAAVSISSLSTAAPREKAEKPAVGEEIDVFDAIEARQIDVKFIPVNANKANLLIENKTKQPLTIRVPDAVAGMPVLAQFPADAGQNLGAPGGAFNIPPEKTRKVEMPALCLDHGKPDPTPRMKYELKPISAVSDKPEVSALIVRYGKGDVATKAAQAAAWHLQNGMSWKELAGKYIEDPRGLKSAYFTRQEIAQGIKLAEVAVAHAKEYAGAQRSFESYSPGASR